MRRTQRVKSLAWATSQVTSLIYIYINIHLENEFTIYVGDLDNAVTEEKLKEFFSAKYKSVISSKIVIDPITKFSKGYGFVKFSDHNESVNAIEEMNGKYLLSRPIKTKYVVIFI